jgi:bile acid-coenzyme A ligase
MNRLAELITQHTARHPDGVAVIESRKTSTRSLTWRQLDETTHGRSAEIVASLDGERPLVAVGVANTLDGVVALVAALRTGLPVLPFNTRAPAGELDRLFGLAQSRYGTVHRLDTGQRLAGTGTRTADYVLTGGGTSGTTKLIEGRIGPDLTSGMLMLLRRAAWATGLRQLVLGPLYHAAPFTSLLSGLLDAHTIVVAGAFSPENAVEVVERHGVQWMQVTPSHMRRILAAPEVTADRLASLRALLHTAAPCDAVTKRGWIDLLGPKRVYEMYGATERIGMTLARGDEWLARPGTVGKGFLTQIRVCDDHGRAVPPGVVGRVFMRRGKGRRPAGVDLSAVEHTVDGFLTVGDHGHLDEDGYLFLSGRRSDMMTVGGSNVYSAEIERVVMELPGVRDVAVVARPHPDFGSVPAAFVVAATGSGLTAADVNRHCRTALSVHKRPKSVEFVDELPRTEAGKLLRWRLVPS